MKRLVPVLLGVAMAWANRDLPECQPASLQLYEAYYNGPGTTNFSWGYRPLSPTTTSYLLSAWKPHLGCSIAYRFPIAVDASWNMDRPDEHVLPPECQPYNFSADGIAWEGM